MLVYLLTSEQADALRGQYINSATQYNPVLDGVGRWIITNEQVEQTENPEFLWVKSLPTIEHVPPPLTI